MAERRIDDEDLLPGVAETVALLAEPALESDEMVVERMVVELPVELQVLRDGAGLALTASPPTQQIETSVMPVWHRVTLTVEIEEDA